jgi:flavin reductase (DIM6/NTAB) family NADH-FMN oxidoreductase RutF
MNDPSIRYFFSWPLVLVSTISEGGVPNIITLGASSVCSASPPTIGLAMGLTRYSLDLMNRTGDFGVNLPAVDQVSQTDFCGTHSGRDLNKYEATGFTVQPSTKIRSPLILECPVSFECMIVHTAHLGSHDWVIGEIVAVHVAADLLDERGNFDASRVSPLLSHWGEYWSIGSKIESWGYGAR